jgi:hypothetical protein
MKKVEIKSVLEPDFLEAQFQAVQDYLQDVDCINYGGCGISAYAMFLWLQKSNMLTEDVKVVFLHFSTSKKYFQTNQSFYLQGQGNPVAPEHVVLMKNGVMIDSSGVYKKINNYAYQLSVSIEKAEDFLVNSLNSDSWNNMFDRPIVVPIIEKDLGISFRADMRRQNKSWDLETTSN